MNFNIFNSIILAGIIQGFLFGILVATSKKYKSTATCFLVALIVVFSLNNLQYYLQDCGIITSETLFTIIYVPYQLLPGPLLFYYGLKILYPERKLSLNNKLLLLPFVVAFLYSTVYKILVEIAYKPEAVARFFDSSDMIIEFFAILFDQIIVVYLLIKVSTMTEIQKHDFKTASKILPLAWFRNVLIVFLILSFVWTTIAVISYTYGIDTVYYVIWIAMSVMIYWIGHIGIYKYGVQQEREKIRNYSIESTIHYAPEKNKSTHIISLEKMLVGERRFLDPTITLDKIAEELHLSKSHLSRVVNAELKMGFPDYLNALRVEEAKTYLSNPEFANYTLVAIGLEAGFNSKTTFNTAFKKVTAQTPSEFRKQNLS